MIQGESVPERPAGRQLVFLGTGTSTGVPVLGCDCAVCTSADPRNQRTRPSVVMCFPAGNLLVDTTPEMRIQLLREKIGRIHAIAFTHHHADHLFGLDDARLFPKWTGGPVPVFCEQETEDCIRRVFSYAFREESRDWPAGFVPKIHFERIRPGEPFRTLGQEVLPIRLDHGRFAVLGFRIGNLAYCTDVNRIPEASWPLLEGLDTLVLDALRHEAHPTHFSVEEALAAVRRLKPRQAWFTHLSHGLDHEATDAALPDGVRLAYDGLRIDF
ncbi:Phosphoribosyl 1,2-cyclic phosphodiesterase [Aquisphaera giovannonii]|uniref:Phosphoribosyl 1,2-cyclic phosphodiesterase n=1 Tax=Aquisphaera giovannonii TaxID=406548 RepID=A0A5B9VW75_9BACT|nr:MBL fold metallo-hydrolase [Aquisphaera giovannonii]QEH32716.1 Phosphoribosyl 1,2-cyclic phosphodiesterase [Aquisphaera giovannonii]